MSSKKLHLSKETIAKWNVRSGVRAGGYGPPPTQHSVQGASCAGNAPQQGADDGGGIVGGGGGSGFSVHTYCACLQ